MQNTKNVENSYFTRDGGFDLLKDGNVVNSEGLSLMGHKVDADGTFNPLLLEKVVIPPTRTNVNGKEILTMRSFESPTNDFYSTFQTHNQFTGYINSESLGCNKYSRAR